MPAAKAVERFYAEESTPVQRPLRVAEGPPRKATMERAARCLKNLDDLLGTVTKELAEGDLEIADFCMPKS